MEKQILVTGVCGFIGFHMASALRKKGYRVVGLDNFNSYYTPTLKRARQGLLEKEGVEIVEGGVENRTLLQRLFEIHSFTHLLHLAAQAGVRYARTHPEAYLKSNLEGFLSVLETLRLFPRVRLVYASSSSVYGCNEKTPFSIEDVTDRPANFYAATKKANELMAYSYHHLYGIAMVGLRYFTVYGPWGRPDMAYYHFTEKMMRGEAISLFNGGKMARDFTYIDDAVTGTLAALEHPDEGYHVFNIGNHRPEPLLRLVEILERLLQKKATLVFEGASAGEVETTFADISQTQQHLNFTPTTPLDVGLEHFVAWYQSVVPSLSTAE